MQNKYSTFVTKLIEDTISKRVVWNPLQSFLDKVNEQCIPELPAELDRILFSNEYTYVNKSHSFYLEVNNSTLFLLFRVNISGLDGSSSEEVELHFLLDALEPIQRFPIDSSELFELYSVIKLLSPPNKDVENFVDDYLKW